MVSACGYLLKGPHFALELLSLHHLLQLVLKTCSCLFFLALLLCFSDTSAAAAISWGKCLSLLSLLFVAACGVVFCSFVFLLCYMFCSSMVILSVMTMQASLPPSLPLSLSLDRFACGHFLLGILPRTSLAGGRQCPIYGCEVQKSPVLAFLSPVHL